MSEQGTISSFDAAISDDITSFIFNPIERQSRGQNYINTTHLNLDIANEANDIHKNINDITIYLEQSIQDCKFIINKKTTKKQELLEQLHKIKSQISNEQQECKQIQQTLVTLYCKFDKQINHIQGINNNELIIKDENNNNIDNITNS